jgi:hypothetical protein
MSIYVEILIRAPMEALWAQTQMPTSSRSARSVATRRCARDLESLDLPP